ncbi:MAG: bifunctional diaminohydroxyphosphoribosylaminopyrimidine deaminase/5-amino-6-(5-phosphoribosylamino)uracil reductase RibD [Bacteroidia bacterium]|nr:bifunctional diaminohydroxyphosphoribosylaminopyrimidine deaminase/5-amino-6-(5-phosphoribosylamino)uracil reductase RibD [Bacteroidia bacterium]
MVNEPFIKRCLILAQKGLGMTAPNPLVGCVIVHNNTIIGEGWHQEYGKPHAEVNAIENVEKKYGSAILKKCKLYVSLEPCVHYGKTPPCANLIIKKQIPEVIVGCRDSFSLVDGKGIQLLKEAGIKVTEGILEKECQFINRRFFGFHENKRPYIILKWAETSDGYIGSTKSKIQISSNAASVLLHKWRTEESAFIVGTNTIINDNPSLTSRLWKGRNPIRIGIDIKLRANNNSEIYNGKADTIIFTALSIKDNCAKVKFIKINESEDVSELLTKLYENNIQSVVVEGGRQLLESFIKHGLWDEARIFKSVHTNKGADIKAPQFNFEATSSVNLGNDQLDYFFNH